MQCWMVRKGDDGSCPGLLGSSDPILGLTNHSKVEIVLLEWTGWYNSRRIVAKLWNMKFIILVVRFVFSCFIICEIIPSLLFLLVVVLLSSRLSFFL